MCVEDVKTRGKERPDPPLFRIPSSPGLLRSFSPLPSRLAELYHYEGSGRVSSESNRHGAILPPSRNDSPARVPGLVFSLLPESYVGLGMQEEGIDLRIFLPLKSVLSLVR